MLVRWSVSDLASGALSLRLSHVRPNPATGTAWFDLEVSAHSGPVTLSVYFVRLEAGERSVVRKMVALR